MPHNGPLRVTCEQEEIFAYFILKLSYFVAFNFACEIENFAIVIRLLKTRRWTMWLHRFILVLVSLFLRQPFSHWTFFCFCLIFIRRTLDMHHRAGQLLFAPLLQSHCTSLNWGVRKRPPIHSGSPHSRGAYKWSWRVRTPKGQIIWFGLKICSPLQLHWNVRKGYVITDCLLEPPNDF